MSASKRNIWEKNSVKIKKLSQEMPPRIQTKKEYASQLINGELI